MKGDIKLTEGVATARVPANGYMDAAVSGSVAGIEFAVERVHVFNNTEGPRFAPLVLSLDMTPDTLERLGVTAYMAARTAGPAFNESEWLFIADALEYAASQSGRQDFQERCERITADIRTSYTASANVAREID